MVELSLCCEGALGPRSWFSATPKMCFRVSELAGARVTQEFLFSVK